MSMTKVGFHQYPPMDQVIFGKPAAQALREEAERRDAKRVFLMVSRTLNTKTDEIEKIRNALASRYGGTFDGVPQHTTRASAVEATALAAEAKADLIVAVGGGSVVDAAKIVLMCLEHNITDESGLDGFELVSTPEGPRPGPFRAPKVRMIAIPSTLSGGEYNSGTLVTDSRRKLKQIFSHPLMMPLSIILDPEITRHTPQTLWLGSGTRAMDHGIEAVCSPRGNPLVESVCLRGLRYLYDGLQATKENPDDLEGRQFCQLGSWMSAFGLQCRVPMGASHAIGHVLGGTCDVPHYLCTAVMMPSVLKYNQPVTDEAQRKIAEAWRTPDARASDIFAQFIGLLGLPSHLSEVGVTKEKFELIGRNAMLSIFTRANPRVIKSPEDIVEILQLAA
jgi:maleylacetate reductase